MKDRTDLSVIEDMIDLVIRNHDTVNRLVAQERKGKVSITDSEK